jgi:hypothetical protein
MAAHVRLVIPMLLVVSSCAQGAEPAKPACNAQTLGEIWPEKGARVPAVPIEICSRATRKYRWRQLTIDASQLKVKSRPKPVVATVATATRIADTANAKPAATPSE